MSNEPLKNEWIKIAEESELKDIAEGSSAGIEIEKDSGLIKNLVLIRSENGWYVLDNLCTHDSGPLDEGYVDLESCSIECERHGAKFNLKTGAVECMPAVQPIQSYPTKVENGALYVQL